MAARLFHRGAVHAERLLWFFCRWRGHASRFDPRELARKGPAAVILSDQRRIGRD